MKYSEWCIKYAIESKMINENQEVKGKQKKELIENITESLSKKIERTIEKYYGGKYFLHYYDYEIDANENELQVDEMIKMEEERIKRYEKSIEKIWKSDDLNEDDKKAKIQKRRIK